jgi:polyketide cyclase/dehydrase/lipid transport protein
MKILKRILIVIAIIIAIPLIVALFTRNDYAVERQVIINKPRQDVFNYIRLVRNQVNYSKWSKMDPAAKMDYKGIDGTVGFMASWDGKKAGKGEQEITSITEGERMDMGLHFIKPMEGRANAYMATETVGPGQTKVKWGMNGKMSYPMNFMLAVTSMDKMLGGELQEGLDSLKAVLEKQ